METTNNDDLSFDITKFFPEHVCDNIFGNLKGADLLEASLVSTEWYKFIAKSAVCMQKLKLSPKGLKETIEILKKSDRKYENVELYSICLDDMRKILLTCGRKWKRVTMSCPSKLATDLDFINFIAIVEPFVEELKMKYVCLLSNNPKKRKLSEQQKKSLTFPNLKLLEVIFCDISIIDVFQDVVTLTELNFVAYSCTIQKMLRYNKGLKKMATIFNAFNQITSEEISSDITFKLASLEISDIYSRFSHSAVIKANMKAKIKQFLEFHKNTLESLSLNIWMGHETVKKIFHMPKLKHLYLGVFHRGVEETVDWKEINFKQSLSLTSLHFGDFKVNIKILRAFLIAAPNVKKLELHSINDELIASILNLLPNLESLSVDCFDVRDVSDKTYLPNLKEFTMKYYDKRIKESAAEEDRSKFESLFLAEKKTAKAFD